MPISIQLLPDYVHVSWRGKLSNEDVELLSAEMPRIGRQLGMAPNVLHTFDEARGTALRFDVMHSHGSNLKQIKLPNRCRIASVCSHPVGFGMARMMQMLNQNPDLEMEVFSDLDDALRWLKALPTKPGIEGRH